MGEALEKLHVIESRLYKKLVDAEITITMFRDSDDWFYKISIHYKYGCYKQSYTVSERGLQYSTADELYFQLLSTIRYDILRHYIK